LTFDWFNIEFLSCLENLVAWNHISEHHTLLRKLSHKHMHCMSWVIYLNFLSAGKFVLIEYLTLSYIVAYFWCVIWLFYQLFIHACSEANFRENYFSTNFSLFSAFQCEASRRMRSCQLLVWQVDHPNALITRPDVILTSSYLSLCFLCHLHTTTFLLIYHDM
jgi:hypothetical protein